MPNSGQPITQQGEAATGFGRVADARGDAKAELAPNSRPQSDTAPAYLVDVAVPGPGNAQMREKRSGQVARMPGAPLLVDRQNTTLESISSSGESRCEPISPAGGAERQAAFSINQLLTTVDQDRPSFIPRGSGCSKSATSAVHS